MDQIRAFFGWIKRQHFWLLSAIVAVIAVVCWSQAAATLQKEYESAKSKITGEFDKQNRLSRESFHANEVINERQKEEIERQAAEVSALWQRLYDVQSQAVLKWPDALGPDFQRRIAEKSFGDDIHQNMREIYTNYAKQHFPELPKIVKALEMPDDGSRGGAARGGGGMDMRRFKQMDEEGIARLAGIRANEDGELKIPDFIVLWLDQNNVRQKLTYAEVPSSLKIWVTQEDLWVYTTLLQVIANTNKAAGATRNSNAPIKIIQSLEVGKLAAQQNRATGRILRPQKSAGGMGGEGGFGDYGGEMMGGEMGGMGMGGEYGGGFGGEFGFGGEGMGGEGADESAELLSSRYLDESGQPLQVAEGWSSADFGIEYKQLPIRMTLQMDQRWLYHLLAECANAPLQIEVQEVRVNPPDGGSGRGGFGGGANKRRYSLQGSGRTNNFSMGGAGGRGGQEARAFDRTPNLVPVVIQGTIYIFNKPDIEQFQVDDSSALASVE